MKFRDLSATLAIVLSFGSVFAPQPAVASTSGIDYYISAPFVHNSFIDLQAPTTYFEDFENFALAGSTTSAGGNVTWASSNTSQIFSYDVYGGAVTTASSQFVGNGATTPSKYIRPTNGSITISFNVPQKYIGFWWSAGSSGNRVDFFLDGRRVLTLTTQALFEIFGTPPTSGQVINQNDRLEFTNNVSYPRGYYFGNPRGYASTTPSNNMVGNAFNEPFTYLNLFANGAFAFDQVVLSGGGFELDNLVVSSVAQTPNATLHYKVASLYPSVTFNANGGSGNMASQTSGVATDLNPNQFVRSKHEFIGWNTEPNGSGTSYADRANFGFAGNLALFAQWAPNRVAFDSNGGSGVMPSQLSSQSSSLSSNLFTRSGFKFAGWNSSSDGSGTAYPDGAIYTFDASTTLFAQWEVDPNQEDGEEAEQAVRFDGPLLISSRQIMGVSTSPHSAVFTGNRLDRVTAVEANGKTVKILTKTKTSLIFEYVPDVVGVFPVVLFSDFGQIIVQNGLTVIPVSAVQAAPTSAPTVSPGSSTSDSLPVTPSTSPTVSPTSSPGASAPKPNTFTLTQRFFKFRGDRSPVVEADRVAILKWIRNNPGINEVICLGSTSGVPKILTDPSLARKRATNACAIISRELPGVKVSIRYENGKGIGQFFRAVQITVKGSTPRP